MKMKTSGRNSKSWILTRRSQRRTNDDDWEGGGVNGVNAAGCPNLAVTGEYHPLSMIIDNNENSKSELAVDQDDLGLGGDDVQRFQSLSQARTAVFSPADEIHK
ncbi:hypothetical protein QBC45DRAFT_394081 [Copromyces sp. CBS 386.78]|nr:hypothetical protein QBC45DRAFT_394081 [Copromyces sp. CBS 386.78]